MPSADYFGDPALLHAAWATCCSSTRSASTTPSAPTPRRAATSASSRSHEMMKRLNAKIYAEAKRLGVKWILGGECGHMWRVAAPVHGHDERPGRFPRGARVARSPARVFENARSTKMVHICEFTADLITQRQAQARPEPQRPLERHLPRLLQPGARAWACSRSRATSSSSVCNHFHEMPENTIREQTFCCGSGAGLGTDENLEMRHARRAARAPTR